MGTRLSAWSVKDIPAIDSCRAVITGCNSGIGLEAAKILAQKSASIVLACRNTENAQPAREIILSACDRQTSITIVELDIASPQSVRAAAAELLKRFEKIDLLINNAGIAMPLHIVTADGFELQLATNYLSHFALTGLLMPLLSAARVVSVSSLAHHYGRMNLEDLGWARRYRPFTAYAQSKLAILLFTF